MKVVNAKNTGFFLIALVLCTGQVKAEDSVETNWKLQGPAFSYHFSQVGAPLHGTKTVNDGSNIVDGASYSFGSTTITPTPAETAKSFCDRYSLAMHKELADSPNDPRIDSYPDNCRKGLYQPQIIGDHRWNQTNIELGIEYNERNLRTKDVTKYFGGSVVDSNYKVGAYIGASKQFNLLDGNRFHMDAGATAMLWYRSVGNLDGSLKRRVVPVVMPVLSLEDKMTGMGVNISFAPQIAHNGRRYSVNTLMLQLTWLIK